jgi:hypothetical protein
MVCIGNHNFPGIFVLYNPEKGSLSNNFLGKTQVALAMLATRPIGHDLLSLLSKRFLGIGIKKSKDLKCVIHKGSSYITRSTLAYRSSSPEIPLDNEDTQAMESSVTTRILKKSMVPGKLFSLPGIGVASVAVYDPCRDYTSMLGIETPYYIALGHELIHCLHFMSGDTYRHGDDDELSSLHEEARTVGLGIYSNSRISENALRNEWKLPPRTYYTYPGDCDELTDSGGLKLPLEIPTLR